MKIRDMSLQFKIIIATVIISCVGGCSAIKKYSGFIPETPENLGSFVFNKTSLVLDASDAYFHIGLIQMTEKNEWIGPPVIPILHNPDKSSREKFSYWVDVQPSIHISRNPFSILADFRKAQISIPSSKSTLHVVQLDACDEAVVNELVVKIPPTQMSGCLIKIYFAAPNQVVENFTLELGEISSDGDMMSIPAVQYTYFTKTKYIPLMVPYE